jgi:hypothetical protein
MNMANKTNTKTNTVKEGEKKLKNAFALWKQKSKDGKKTYFSGKSNTGINIRAFYNLNKQNPKEPDLRVYAVEENKLSKDEIASLWCNVSKKETKYFTGTYDGCKVVGFLKAGDNEKAPDIAVYFREAVEEVAKEAKSKEKEKKVEKAEYEEIPADESLPF